MEKNDAKELLKWARDDFERHKSETNIVSDINQSRQPFT
jgi:hypothetical protein